MTLRVTFVSGDYVLQVSDRLVSVDRRAGVESYDREANKTVVYFARDAYVSIGYTGLAYLEDRPTDQWIAEKLIGEEVESRRGPSGGISQRITAGPVPPWFGIGTARRILRRERVAVTSRRHESPPGQPTPYVHDVVHCGVAMRKTGLGRQAAVAPHRPPHRGRGRRPAVSGLPVGAARRMGTRPILGQLHPRHPKPDTGA